MKAVNEKLQMEVKGLNHELERLRGKKVEYELQETEYRRVEKLVESWWAKSSGGVYDGSLCGTLGRLSAKMEVLEENNLSLMKEKVDMRDLIARLQSVRNEKQVEFSGHTNQPNQSYSIDLTSTKHYQQGLHSKPDQGGHYKVGANLELQQYIAEYKRSHNLNQNLEDVDIFRFLEDVASKLEEQSKELAERLDYICKELNEADLQIQLKASINTDEYSSKLKHLVQIAEDGLEGIDRDEAEEEMKYESRQLLLQSKLSGVLMIEKEMNAKMREVEQRDSELVKKELKLKEMERTIQRREKDCVEHEKTKNVQSNQDQRNNRYVSRNQQKEENKYEEEESEIEGLYEVVQEQQQSIQHLLQEGTIYKERIHQLEDIIHRLQLKLDSIKQQDGHVHERREDVSGRDRSGVNTPSHRGRPHHNHQVILSSDQKYEHEREQEGRRRNSPVSSQDRKEVDVLIEEIHRLRDEVEALKSDNEEMAVTLQDINTGILRGEIQIVPSMGPQVEGDQRATFEGEGVGGTAVSGYTEGGLNEGTLERLSRDEREEGEEQDEQSADREDSLKREGVYEGEGDRSDGPRLRGLEAELEEFRLAESENEALIRELKVRLELAEGENRVLKGQVQSLVEERGRLEGPDEGRSGRQMKTIEELSVENEELVEVLKRAAEEIQALRDANQEYQQEIYRLDTLHQKEVGEVVATDERHSGDGDDGESQEPDTLRSEEQWKSRLQTLQRRNNLLKARIREFQEWCEENGLECPEGLETSREEDEGTPSAGEEEQGVSEEPVEAGRELTADNLIDLLIMVLQICETVKQIAASEGRESERLEEIVATIDGFELFGDEGEVSLEGLQSKLGKKEPGGNGRQMGSEAVDGDYKDGVDRQVEEREKYEEEVGEVLVDHRVEEDRGQPQATAADQSG